MNKIPKTVSEYLARIGSKGGERGGRATSKAKAEAARKNGKLGGRPRKNKVKR